MYFTVVLKDFVKESPKRTIYVLRNAHFCVIRKPQKVYVSPIKLLIIIIISICFVIYKVM